jgi:hypothetical protein
LLLKEHPAIHCVFFLRRKNIIHYRLKLLSISSMALCLITQNYITEINFFKADKLLFKKALTEILFPACWQQIDYFEAFCSTNSQFI